MKMKILLCLFFAFTFRLMASNNQGSHRLDGVWVNVERHDFIRIKVSHDEIFIKGLPLFHGAIRFEHQYGKTFRDKWGHRLTIEDGNTIFIKWSRHQTIRFIKLDRNDRRHRSHEYNRGHHDRQGDKNWDNDEQYRSYDNDDDWKENHGSFDEKNDYGDDQSEYDNKTIHTDKIEGTYRTSIKNKEIIAILETRDGLKAKVSGSSVWKDYTRNKYNEDEFIDRDGNSYIFKNHNLKWRSQKHDDFVIELQKISDVVRY